MVDDIPIPTKPGELLKALAERLLYDSPSHRVLPGLIRTVEALRAGAAALETAAPPDNVPAARLGAICERLTSIAANGEKMLAYGGHAPEEGCPDCDFKRETTGMLREAAALLRPMQWKT